MNEGTHSEKVTRGGESAGVRFRAYAEIVVATLLASLLLKGFVVDAVYVPSPSMEGTLLTGDYLLVNKLVYGARSPKHLPFTQAEFPSIQFPKLKSITRGDVVVFELPVVDPDHYSDQPVYFVKRCVAVAGDTISMQNGKLFLNRAYSMDAGGHDRDFGPIVVPKRGDTMTLTQENFIQWQELISREGHTIKRLPSVILVDGKPTTSYTVTRNYLFVLGDNREHSYDSRHWGFLPEENVIGKAMLVYWSESQAGGIRWERIGSFIR
ncbi:MAG: signal peptidase I [Ignavibacteria bacterium]|nr:signal peptidase I [Ignavibacteria bacterium]MBI3765102.1 signal peptidase I [Ignavibacteriales bacterium]